MTSKMLETSTAYKPFHYPWAVQLAEEHERIHWIEEEADVGEDVSDWKNRLTEVEKNHVIQILRLFTQLDVEVGGIYYDKMIPIFKNNEIRNMLGSFACREAIHQRAYALVNDTLGLPDDDFCVFKDYAEMADKIEFMQDTKIDSHTNIALMLAKSVFNEGVSLFASFVMLLNYERFGKMKGMCKVVRWSVRDESMHVLGVSRLFREFVNEHRSIVTDTFKKAIYDMSRKVVELEDAFIDLAYSMGECEGLAADEVKTYIRHIADRRLIQLGLKPNFEQKDNPLEWLDWILNGADQTNFFEGRVAEYSVASLKGDWGWEDIEECYG